jgi:hypothetical protein
MRTADADRNPRHRIGDVMIFLVPVGPRELAIV